MIHVSELYKGYYAVIALEISSISPTCFFMAAMSMAKSRPAMAYRMHSYFLVKWSKRSGRGSRPPSPTKTRRPSTEAASAALQILSTAAWKMGLSCWPGMPSL